MEWEIKSTQLISTLGVRRERGRDVAGGGVGRSIIDAQRLTNA